METILIGIAAMLLTSLAKKTGLSGRYLAAIISIFLGAGAWAIQSFVSVDIADTIMQSTIEIYATATVVYNVFVKNGLVQRAIGVMGK